MTNPTHHDQKLLCDLIHLALEEDGVDRDLTTCAIIPAQATCTAYITAKADGILSGTEVARMVLEAIDTEGDCTFVPLADEGAPITRGQDLITIAGPYRILLAAERTMLNFLQRMSGIATATHRLVTLCVGSHTKILDTRKTAPGHRFTDKLAVRHGGGSNHRHGLYDMCLIKDNHIRMAGGITPAVEAARRHLPLSIKIEVETENLDQVREAVGAGADLIMLDNMPDNEVAEAVRLIAGRARTEASGNITPDRIRSLVACGVDYISVGALTHSVTALDMSMNIGHKEDKR